MSEPETPGEALTPRRWLNELAAPERRLLGLATLAGVVAGALTLGQMGALAWLVSELVVATRAPGELWPGFLALGVILPLRALAQWAQEAAGLEASLRIRRRARAALLDHLARLGPVRLASRHSASLANQLVEQVEALDGYFARFLPQLRLAVVLPLLVLVVVVWLDWLAALFLLLSAPLIPLFMALVGMGAERLNRQQFAAVARLSGHFIDRVRGITTLQLFGRTREATAEVHAAADDYRRLSMRTLRLAFLSSAVLEFFASVAIAVVAIYVGFGLLGYIDYGPSPGLTLFSGLLVLLLAPEFFQPLRTLSQHYHDRAAALGAADGLVALLDEAPAPGRDGDRGPVPTASGELATLHAVTVEYPGRGRVLGPLDLAVRPGEVLAITGPSGAGKSTLLQLLAGFVGPGQGERRLAAGLAFAWMDQRPLLIQGSLADNLRLAAPEADEPAMRAALGRAGLGELVAGLPQGLATPLGERGVGLSGGQAQRLALARVFLSPAPLVLLDEPTASLDADTEARVVAALGELAGAGRSLVIATHHPALMALADRRLELVGGRAVARAAQEARHD
ncbi:thiol reductant ABC exporter subunit CydD [Halomonas sp. EGI 63088]|uniref:Thiol reductant ABC exporter subunit CydD n=1 Tax=Halomonas flagellata TaxID=2920385 RepID=A0ABS9RV35_9GAMM|nr:thiol reductant ABC exporter subunit CydD [Halomonas flagellata]MCH4563705.1 thiol reductant ABC exporter subunit CydD [Halomonas flagellata]